jgi:glycosyltransferase involved in cell wall biosynthesis
MKKAIVCHVTSVHPPFDVRIFYKEAKSLAKNGFDTYLVVSGAENQIIDDVKIVGVNVFQAGRLYRMFKHSKLVIDRALEIKADIYHVHDPELLPYVGELKATGAKVIYDSHEDVPTQTLSKTYVPYIFRWPLSLWVKLYENYQVRKIDAIVAATETIRNRFKSVHKNIVVINNYPFVEELKTNTETQVKELAVCYVGSVAKVRGAVEIVKAIELSKSAKLYLAGSTNEAGLYEQLRSMDGWKKVIDVGYIPRTKVAEVMGKCMVGIVTLHPEVNYLSSIPIKMFEYLSAGIPIICSDFPHWREMLGQYNCARFVNPLDPYDIAESIDWYIDNPEMAKEMGLRGQKLVEDVFNWKSEEIKLVDLYKKLAAGEMS